MCIFWFSSLSGRVIGLVTIRASSGRSGSSPLCWLISGMGASSTIDGLVDAALAQVYKCMTQQPKNATCHGMNRKIRMKIRHMDISVLLEVVPLVL